MRLRQFALPFILTLGVLSACGEPAIPSYELTFYQPDANHSDFYTVLIGKTQLSEIKTYANGLKDYTKKGYDRTWDWDNYDFEEQTEDWTILAIPVLHNYRISFRYQGVEKGYTTYTIKDSKYTVPEMKPDQKGYKYSYPTVDIKGKTEDIVIDMTLEVLNFEARFFKSTDDKNPTVVTYNYNQPVITVPDGPVGYTNCWETEDKAVSFDAGEEINMEEEFGVENFDNFSFYLNKTPNEYEITLDPNGGTLEGETTFKVTFGEKVTLPVPTFKNGAEFLGWSDPNSGTLVQNGQPYNVPDDTTLMARYGISFDNASQHALINDGTRGYSTIGSMSVDASDKVEGTGSLKMISQSSTTFSCTFDDAFIKSAFADPSIVAINFACKTQVSCTKFSYANTVNHPYERDCCNNPEIIGYGAQPYWKKFSLTREMYLNKPSNQNLLITTVGGQLPIGNAIWIDDVRPVTEPLTNWGFENSMMVPYNPTDAWYKKAVSFRDFNYKEIFLFAPTSECDSNYGFSYDIKSEGIRSIKAHKNPSANAGLKVLLAENVESITFDVYVTTDLNPSATFLKGNGTALDTEILKADTWTTYTVTSEDLAKEKAGDRTINQFLWLTGSPEYDIYIDNLRIVTTPSVQ